jgi:uncharacterized protein (TIGR02145 family)
VMNGKYEKVYESEAFQNGWDGKRNGKYVAPGSYSWVLDIDINDREIRTLKGELIVVAAGAGAPVAAPAAAKPVQSGPDVLYDERDGRTYKTVRIGTQVWMAENLAYSSGSGWCYGLRNDNCETFGKLFEWEAAKNACPSGWQLPTEDEWKVLIEYVGGKKVAGGKLKESGYSHWASPNTDASDMFGFGAIPGGFRHPAGLFKNLGNMATFWTSSKCSGNGACAISFSSRSANAEKIATNRLDGRSVRCIKNN